MVTSKLLALIGFSLFGLSHALEVLDNQGNAVILGTVINQTAHEITLWAPKTGFTLILKPHEKQVVNAMIFSNHVDALVWQEQLGHISFTHKGQSVQYVLMLEQAINEFDNSISTSIKLQKPTSVWKSFFKDAPTLAVWQTKHHNSLNTIDFRVNIVFMGSSLENSQITVTEQQKNRKTNTKAMAYFDL